LERYADGKTASDRRPLDAELLNQRSFSCHVSC
jgi:hypothetical protein